MRTQVVRQSGASRRRLYLQNHWGLYRSDDSGDSWQDIAKRRTFRFLDFAWWSIPTILRPFTLCRLSPMSIAARRKQSCACTVRGNGGASWEPLTRGLPQKNALETILRDSLATDTCDPAGIYFGTRSGKIYGSNDDGKSWQLIHEGCLPWSA